MNKLLALALLVSCAPLCAQTVYKSVENGVTTYSDSPPDSGSAQILTIDVAPPAEDAALEARLADMRETTDRMADDRRERERHRAELRDMQQTMQQTAAAAPVQPSSANVPATSGWEGNYWPGNVRPIRPRPPFRPGRPIQAQPLPQPYSVPGWSVMQPGNAQLMRPVVSSRRQSP